MPRLPILSLAVLILNVNASAGLVSHWRGEGNALDSVGTNHGTVVNTVQYTPGVIGQGFLFPDSGYVRIPSAAAGGLVSPNAFSIAMWMRTDDADPPPDGGPGAYMSFGTSGASSNGFFFGPSGGTSVWFVVHTSANNDATNYLQHSFPFWNLGQVYHVAATFDAATHTMALYQDGVQIASRSDVIGNGMLVDPAATFDIGRWFVPGSPFEGMLDDVRFYNHALTANEVAALVPEPTGIAAVVAAAVAAIRRRRRSRRNASRGSRREANCEALEARRMLFVHYPGSPSWSFGNITYSYTNALDGGLAGVTPTEVSNAVNESFALWAAVIPRTFTRVADPDPNFTTDETYSTSGWPLIRIGQHNIDGIDNTLAHAWRPGSNGQNGDLHFDISEPWNYGSSGPLDYDILETALHEIGHTLGLDHQGSAPPGGVQAIMNPSYVGRFTGPGTGFLLQDDINGVQALYGAGLGYALDIDGTMYVAGTAGPNTITVSLSGGNFTVNSAGFGSFTRSTSGINKLVIRGGNGNDSYIINQMPFAVEVRDHAGTNDTIRLQGADTNNAFGLGANNQISGHCVSSYTGMESIELFGGNTFDQISINAAPTIPVTINSRFGNDTFFVNAMSNLLTLEGDFGDDAFTINSTGSASAAIMRGGFDQDTFNYQEINIATTADGGDGNDTFNLAVNGGFEKIRGAVVLNGGAGDDVANLATNAPGSVRVIISPVTFNGGTNQDTLNVGGGWLDAVASLTTFSGGNDGLDRANLYDDAFSAPYDYVATSSTLTRDPFFGGLNFSGVWRVTLECSQGDNRVTIGNGISAIIDARGNGGNDSFIVGGGQIQGSAGHSLNGGSGINNITFDDRNDPTNRTWQIFPDRVNFAGLFLPTIGFQSVSVLAGNGEDTIFFVAATYDQAITIDGGGGRDQVQVAGVRIANLTVRGGNDSVFDFLDIDDRTLPGNVVGGEVYTDRISREMFPQQPSNIHYSGFASISWRQQNNQNVIAVYGISNEIAPIFQFAIYGGTLDDYVEVYSRDAQGNQTINGNLDFTGGDGPDRLRVLSGSVSENYRLYPQFSGATAYIGGTGAGWIASGTNVENLDLFGSGANDTFAVEKFSAGTHLAIFGGGGNDNCTIGNGDMAANLTNAASFLFDGQAGTDRFTVDNGLTNAPWSYLARAGILNAGRGSPSYLWSSNTANIESQYVLGGSSDDTFHMEGSASGVYTEWNGFGGKEALYLSDIFTGNLDPIRGPVRFNPGAGISSIFASDVADTTPDTVHLDATSLGAYAGDNLFGPGGSLTFENIVNVAGSTGITLLLGQNNTVYAQPFPNVRTELTSGGGGSIKLALAGVQSPVINGNSASGSVTSSNRQPLLWSGFAGPIQTDAIAPVPQKIKFKLGGGGRSMIAPTSIDVLFSEDVSGLLSPSFLSLQNLTTSSTIPTSNIAVSWNAAALTATFTFPGYPGGVLPSGSYQAQLLAGLTDQFGNPTAASNPYKFIWAAGTSGNDSFRIANNASVTAVQVFMNNDATPAFVGAMDVAQIAIAGDTGNDSLVVDCANLNPTPTVDGITFDGGDGADSIMAKGSANVDGFTFLNGSIMPSATTITHPNVEAQLYDGGGGFDSLGVYGTTVILPVTQRFVSIDLNQSGKLVMQPNLGGVLTTRALAIASGSTLDLNDSDLIFDYTGTTTRAQVQAWINSGRSGGTWTGTTGITSTAAKNANPRNRTLGVMEATEFKSIYGTKAPFNGETTDTSAILIKYTYYGDADFNGQVNFDDYSRADNGFSTNKTGWMNGDFDGSGAVNFDDYSLIDLAFNTQSGTL